MTVTPGEPDAAGLNTSPGGQFELRVHERYLFEEYAIARNSIDRRGLASGRAVPRNSVC